MKYYLQKPVDIEMLKKLIKAIYEWYKNCINIY